MDDYLSTFLDMIEEIENAVALNKGATFLIYGNSLGSVLQDSSHFFITPKTNFKHSVIFQSGSFMEIPLFFDWSIPDDDYILRFGFSTPDAREIAINKLLGDNLEEEILDLSHYKLIIE